MKKTAAFRRSHRLYRESSHKTPLFSRTSIYIILTGAILIISLAIYHVYDKQQAVAGSQTFDISQYFHMKEQKTSSISPVIKRTKAVVKTSITTPDQDVAALENLLKIVDNDLKNLNDSLTIQPENLNL